MQATTRRLPRKQRRKEMTTKARLIRAAIAASSIGAAVLTLGAPLKWW
jgi:hypothetical protein